MPDVAILARQYDTPLLARFFPDARFFFPGEPKLGLRFDEVLVFFVPENRWELEWAQGFMLSLRPASELKWMITTARFLDMAQKVNASYEKATLKRARENNEAEAIKSAVSQNSTISVSGVSSLLGISPARIYWLRKRYNIQMFKPQDTIRTPTDRSLAIYKMRKSGKTYVAIGKYFGLSLTRVREIYFKTEKYFTQSAVTEDRK